MRDFFADQQILYTSERFDPIYSFFNKTKDIKIHDLFLLAASIGAKKASRKKRIGKGREFRSNYLSSKQRSMAFSILLTDREIGRRFDEFTNPEYIKTARSVLEEYAEAGMEIIIEEVFGEKWDGSTLDVDYNEYEVDLAAYCLRILQND